MFSRYWVKCIFCWNVCFFNKISDVGCIFYILLLMVFLYIYMNYFGIRYKLEKFMFEFILKFLIVFYIICGYLCINKKKKKIFVFF